MGKIDMDNLNILQELAIIGFKFGDDNYGEKIVGVSSEIKYNKISDHYSITVFLEQTDGHPCTSGIGFYLKGDLLEVYSCKNVMRVEITRDIKRLLNKV